MSYLIFLSFQFNGAFSTDIVVRILSADNTGIDAIFCGLSTISTSFNNVILPLIKLTKNKEEKDWLSKHFSKEEKDSAVLRNLFSLVKRLYVGIGFGLILRFGQMDPEH